MRRFLALIALCWVGVASAQPTVGPVDARNLGTIPFVSTGGSAARSAAARAAEATDVLDFGAKCDGTTDDTTAIINANNAVTGQGGGILRFPNGTCITGTITIFPNVYYQGEGRDATVVKAKASLNAAVFLGQNFATLTGTNATTGVGGFAIKDMTVDGNNANNTSGDGIQVYGYGFDIQNVSIRNTAADGLYTEWSTNSNCPTNSPPDCMEAFFSNMLIHDYKGNGWVFKGPHDSQMNRVIIWTFSNNAAKGLYLTGTCGASGIYGSIIHIWGANQYGLYADSQACGTTLSEVQLEGATNAQLVNGGFKNQFHHLWMYGCFQNSITAQQTTATNLSVTVNANSLPISPGMTITGAGITAGTRITAATAGQTTGNFTTTSSGTTASEAMTANGNGIMYGDSLNSGTNFGSQIDATMDAFCGVSWTYEGGENKLDATFESATPIIQGTPNSITDSITGWNWATGNGNVVLSACGTTPAVNESIPSVGKITLGTGSPTACTVTVPAGLGWPRAPHCNVNANNGTAWGVSAASTTAVTFTGSATAATLYYRCYP
jgi:hypothetical protein